MHSGFIKRVAAWLLLSVPTAFASVNLPSPHSTHHAPFDGFHGGFEVGVLNADFETKATDEQSNVVAKTTAIQVLNDRLSGVSPVGRIFIGYGWQFQRYYLGLNLAASLFFARGSIYSPNILRPLGLSDPQEFNMTNRMTLKNSVSFMVQPGLLIQPTTLAFLSVGPVIAKGKLQSTTYNRFANGVPNQTIGFINNVKKRTMTGIVAGLGFKHFISGKIAFVMQYIYTYYGRVHSVVEPFALPTVPSIYNNASFNAQSSTFLLGLDFYLQHHENNLDFAVVNGGFSGIFIDAFFGLIHNLTEFSNRGDFVFTSSFINQQFGSVTNLNFNGGLGIGYGGVLNSIYYLGGEISTALGNSTSRLNASFEGGLTTQINLVTLREQERFNFDLKPGVLLGGSDNLLYFVLGLSEGRFTFSPAYDGLDTLGHVSFNDAVRVHRAGLRLGIGFATKITANMAIGIQDVFTVYRSIGVIAANGSANTSAQVASSVTPRTNNITLHWDYFLRD